MGKDLPLNRVGLLFVAALLISYLLLSRLGVEKFVYVLMGLVFGLLFTVWSFRSTLFLFVLVILGVGALRYFFFIEIPILPDLPFDRMILFWFGIVFMIKLFAEGKNLRKPWGLDILILAHGLFILARVLMSGGTYLHMWTMSVMTPYLVYFYAKNCIQTKQQIRVLFLALLFLSFYYYVTSIAEKFHINWLLYPQYMAESHHELVGRSNGPFRNAGIFGNALGMLLPLNLYFIATSKRTLLRIFCLMNLALGFAAIYFTYTRGTWMAGILGVAGVVWFNRNHYLRTLLPMSILVPVVALLFLGVGQDKFMKERVENEDTIQARVGTAITALRVWRDYPFLGCGSYNYINVKSTYIEPINVPILGSIRYAQFRHTPAHDQYWGPLAEDGLVGTGLQMGIFVSIFLAVRRKWAWKDQGSHFAIFVIPIFIGIFANYLFGGLTISYRHTSILGTLFYMAAGIVSGYERENIED